MITDKAYEHNQEEFLGKVTSQSDANPKNRAAKNKPKTSAVPPIAIMALGAAMQNGADKYGKFNWRGTEVTASVFYDAIMRHLQAWYSGENFALDSNIHHLAHIMAGCAIILDASHNNVFVDDRPTKGMPVTEEAGYIYDYKYDTHLSK
jgi:hypothetical protein